MKKIGALVTTIIILTVLLAYGSNNNAKSNDTDLQEKIINFIERSFKNDATLISHEKNNINIDINNCTAYSNWGWGTNEFNFKNVKIIKGNDNLGGHVLSIDCVSPKNCMMRNVPDTGYREEISSEEFSLSNDQGEFTQSTS